MAARRESDVAAIGSGRRRCTARPHLRVRRAAEREEARDEREPVALTNNVQKLFNAREEYCTVLYSIEATREYNLQNTCTEFT